MAAGRQVTPRFLTATPLELLNPPSRLSWVPLLCHAVQGVPEDNRCHCKAWTQAQHDAEHGGASCSVQ